MLRRAKHCVFMFLAVLAGYWLYAWTVVPLVEPPQRSITAEVSNTPVPSTSAQYADLLTRYFPPGAWELGEPKIIETEQGLFLFRDYLPQDDGRIELKPCTLLILSAARRRVFDAAHPPIIMHAPNGAALQFDRDSDTLKGDFGKLRAGKLDGEIRVFRPETSAGAGDQLEVQTRNIQLNEQEIWTPHEVAFRFGRSFGRGRDLKITLAPAASTTKGKREMAPTFGGAKTLELIHVEQVHLQMPPKKPQAEVPADAADSAGAAQAALAGRALLFGGDTALQVKCNGPFRFDFDEPSATFEKQVDVTRLDSEGPGDQLNCELLTLYFARFVHGDDVDEPEIRPLPPVREAGDDESATIRGQSPTDATNSPRERKKDGLEIERIVATGHPAILRAPSVGATARAEYLEYNLKTRRIQLRDSSTAILQHEERIVRARRVEYEIHEQPGRPGRIWADGPGRFISSDEQRNDSPHHIELTWGHKLLLRPHDGNQVLTLTGGAALKYGEDGSFDAQEIHLWLQEIAELPRADASSSPSASREATPRYSLVPDRLLAQGDVKVDSARFSGNTKRLEAWFDQNPRGAMVPVNQAATGNIGGPPIPGHSPFDSLPVGEAGSSQKLNLAGELVQVHLARNGKQMQLQDAVIEGDVRLTQMTEATAGGEGALTIKGRTLQVRDASSGRAYVKIIGQPAEVAVRGMTAVADAIQLNQAENRLWIDGPGRMSIPLPSPAAAQPTGQMLYQNERLATQRAERLKGQPLVISWQRGMLFDGTVAHFDQQVETRGGQWVNDTDFVELFITGATLDAQLNQTVHFAQPPRSEQLGLRQITYGGNVIIASRTIRDGGQVSFEQMQLSQLVVDQMDGLQSGTVRGVGPGTLTSTRFGSPALPAANVGRPAAPANVPPGSGLSQLHVQFARGLQGSFGLKQIVFEDQVRAVYGPVQRWEDQLRPEPGATGDDGVTLSCNRLNVAEGTSYRPGQRTVELDALGNALVETRQFAARGARISYSQAKEMVVLEGDLRGEAELWQLPRNQAGRPDAIARKIMYWRQDNRIEVDGAKYVDLSRFGNSLNLPRAGG